jgi:hypothetical protein
MKKESDTHDENTVQDRHHGEGLRRRRRRSGLTNILNFVVNLARLIYEYSSDYFDQF